MRVEVKAEYNGKNIVPLQQELIDAFKADLKKGAKVALTMEPWEERRSRSQQGLLHEIIGRCARATGYTLEALKMQCKVDLGHYIPAEKILSGDVEMPQYRGRFVDLHSVYESHPEGDIAFVRSEADYSKKMENEFIEYMLTYAHENGVAVDDIERELRGDGT